MFQVQVPVSLVVVLSVENFSQILMSHAEHVEHEDMQLVMTLERLRLHDLLSITQMGRIREEMKFLRTIFKDLNQEILTFLFDVPF